MTFTDGEVDIRAGVNSNLNAPYAAVDFSVLPDGTFPTTDKHGMPLHLEYAVANSPGVVAVIENGAARLTTPSSGNGGVCYIGLQSDGQINEIGCKFVSGVTIGITEHDVGIFGGWNWPIHIQFGQYTINFGMFVNGTPVAIASAAYTTPISTTIPSFALIKFQNNTCRVYLNGKLVCSATDTRFSSMVRRYPFFEPNVSPTAYSKVISAYVKTSKITEMAVADSIPAMPFSDSSFVMLGTPITLTDSWQTIRGNVGCSGISSAIVTARFRLNQTSPGSVQIKFEGMTVNSVLTANIITVSQSVKDDVITAVAQVNGLGGGYLRIYAKGADANGSYGTIPIQTGADAASLSVIPTAYWTNP